MAQLTFVEKTVNANTTLWEATATVNADFNLHIERVKPEYIEVDVTTVENGKYKCVYAHSEEEVFDHDFNAIVYPKYIKVRLWSKPVDGKCYIKEAE